MEPVSASRSEAFASRDAVSMAPRHSISFPLGNHGYMHNLRFSTLGTRAASEAICMNE